MQNFTVSMQTEIRMDPALIIQVSLHSCIQTDAPLPAWTVLSATRHTWDCLLKILNGIHDAASDIGSKPTKSVQNQYWSCTAKEPKTSPSHRESEYAHSERKNGFQSHLEIQHILQRQMKSPNLNLHIWFNFSVQPCPQREPRVS